MYIVVSGPPASGKTSLCKALLGKTPSYVLIPEVSHRIRPPTNSFGRRLLFLKECFDKQRLVEAEGLRTCIADRDWLDFLVYNAALEAAAGDGWSYYFRKLWDSIGKRKPDLRFVLLASAEEIKKRARGRRREVFKPLSHEMDKHFLETQIRLYRKYGKCFSRKTIFIETRGKEQALKKAKEAIRMVGKG